MLHQGSDPVGFFSKQIAPRQKHLAAYERELIGLVQAVCHWQPYLWERSFLVCTDHYSLNFLLDQRLSTIPQHHWVSKLLGFDFCVEFHPGRQNIVADALSCRDAYERTADLCAISSPQFPLFENMRQQGDSDEELSELKACILAGTTEPHWNIVDGLVTFKGRVYVPITSPTLPAILEAAHTVRHEGIQKTLHRLQADFHVPQARKLVKEFVQTCVTCQRNKWDHLHPTGLLQPLPVPQQIWDDISMDFVEGVCTANRSYLQ